MKGRAAATLAATALLSGACRGPAPLDSPPRQPVRWIPVERPVGELLEAGVIERGDFVPEARILVLEPVPPEGLVWTEEAGGGGYFVEVLEVRPPGLVAPGEVVTARVRVGNSRPGLAYRLVARPSHPEVRIVGAAVAEVRGAEEAVFRFTSLSGGQGGIEVGVGEGERP